MIIAGLSSLVRFRHYLSLYIFIACSTIYLLGMYRTIGVDIGNYTYDYYRTNDLKIFDPGYNFISHLFSSLGVSFEFFLVICGLFNIFVVYRLAGAVGVSKGLLLLIFLLHGMIVRDFAQFRVGLAFFIAVIAVITSGKKRWIWGAIAISFHASLAWFFMIFFIAEWITTLKSNRKKVFVICILSLFSLISRSVINNLLLKFSSRAEIYSNWDAEGYGAAAVGFGLIPLLFFLILANVHRLGIHNILNDVFTITLVGSILTFVIFYDIAIVAFRLTNIASALYPIVIVQYIENKKINILYKLVFFALVGNILLFRANSEFIISKIGMAFLP